MTQGTQTQYSVTTWRYGAGREVGRGLRREGTHVCLWPLHVSVWQKPSQYCNYPLIKINKYFFKRLTIMVKEGNINIKNDNKQIQLFSKEYYKHTKG